MSRIQKSTAVLYKALNNLPKGYRGPVAGPRNIGTGSNLHVRVDDSGGVMYHTKGVSGSLGLLKNVKGRPGHFADQIARIKQSSLSPGPFPKGMAPEKTKPYQGKSTIPFPGTDNK